MMLEYAMRLPPVAALTVAIVGLPTRDAGAQASSPDEIVGVWEAENGNVKFEMFDAGGTYAARVIYGRCLVEADGRTFKKDIHIPDPKLRGRSLEGIVFITDLEWDASDRRWEGGSFYSGATGRTVSAEAVLVDGKMELRAYMGTPMIGETMVLRRAH